MDSCFSQNFTFCDLFNPQFIKKSKILEGFRKLHRKIGKSNKKYISSPENLLMYIIKHNKLPHTNLLVDIYNLISVRYLLSIGAHDLHAVIGNISLRITNGKR